MSWKEFIPKNPSRNLETVTVVNNQKGKEKIGFSVGLRTTYKFFEHAGVTLLYDRETNKIGMKLDKTMLQSTIPFPKKRDKSQPPVYMSIPIKEFVSKMDVRLEPGVKRYKAEIESFQDENENKTLIISFIPANGTNVVKKGPPKGPKKAKV